MVEPEMVLRTGSATLAKTHYEKCEAKNDFFALSSKAFPTVLNEFIIGEGGWRLED